MITALDSLEIIKGRQILDVSTEVNLATAINSGGDHDVLVEIPLKISFDEYTLFIYNKWAIVSSTLKFLEDLKGERIVKIKSFSQILELCINNLDYIKIDLSDNGYTGPESLALYGPNNLIMVWN